MNGRQVRSAPPLPECRAWLLTQHRVPKIVLHNDGISIMEAPMSAAGRQQEKAAAALSSNANADAILDTAEELFAQKGFSAVSMRMIAAESGQHLASANYYFGSKAGLFEAAFLRRIVPVNNRRVELLAQTRDAGPLTLASIVEAFVRPLFESADGGDSASQAKLIMLFSKQVLTNPDEHSYLQTYYDEVARAFIPAIRESMPGLSEVDALWGYNYMIGILVFTLAGKAAVARLPEDYLAELEADESDAVTIERLVRFICAGLQALSTGS